MRRACPSCGTESPGGAKFCQECGASLAAGTSSENSVPWIAVGAVGLVLAVVGGFMILDRRERAALPAAAPVATTTAAVSTAPNITPAQAAEQLFNHVMAASERGETAEARRFAPMALEAYGQLASLDDDAHYHVGLIHVTIGDLTSAQRELEAVYRSEPNHLLGIMLEHAIAEAKGDAAGVTRAFERFLSAYDTEILTERDEYRGHRSGIDGFRVRANAALTLTRG